jgi:hypothetical protein
MFESAWRKQVGIKRLQWFDATPYQAVLYEIDSAEPRNKKIAEVTYNYDQKTFVSLIYDPDSRIPLRDAQINIPTKIEAMEAAMALLVASRFDKAN